MSATADQVIAPPGGAGRRGSAFFFRFTVLITAMVFAGFILNRIVHWAEFERFTTWIALHGLFSAAWYLLLINQLRLVGGGDMATHRRWGKLSIWLVAAILVTGALMTLGLYEYQFASGNLDAASAEDRVRAGSLIGGTVIQWLLFAALYTLGVLNVRRPTHHKRFMVASAIQMMPAGLSRLIGLVGLPGPATLVIMLGLYVSILVYDWRTDRRLHWSTLVSLGLFLILPISFFTLFNSQPWGDWVVRILGAG